MEYSLQHEKSEEEWYQNDDVQDFFLPFLRLDQIVDQQDADESDETVIDDGYNKLHENSVI
jgi:hypothetical protein